MKDDTISRQEAIDALDGVKVDEENCTEYDIGYNDGIDFAVSRLSVLPSAQPYTDEEIQKMPTIELDQITYGMNGWNKGSDGRTMVNCLLDKCEYNRDCFCTREEITLDKEHSCTGGCDDGWEIKDEDDED